ncbi:hypothetical protein C8F04DRAFT_964059 [Mycena alexandri]|uniref:SH3 domain-containing protein n=1 Tax=Mycena alexandri TaxID=1745969 RepID=A0AAD6WXN1_9AGAR|nr:hypothetical protein C8F04DRAFT_964059 [Mycena alexandri]
MSVRPFSPSEAFAFPAPPRENRSGDATPTMNQTLMRPAPTAHARYSENPFADAFSVPDTPTAPSAQFDAVETIWRPFEQTLQDEITVNVGDQVKVLAVYDDGWAMIERISAGRGKTVGLVPIDCMRKGQESVSSFLAAKRVSSVDATGYLAMAV